MRSSIVLGCLLLTIGCNGGSDRDEGLAILGGGTHDVSGSLTLKGSEDVGNLNLVQDLDFNPEVNGEIWVVNKDDDSVTIFDDMADNGSFEHIVDPFALHFMEKVTSISFGAPGTFATCQDGRNTYNGQGEPNDFTGPSLWTSNRDDFGITNPAAVDFLGFDLGSHLDMLHESPQCMGIEWDHDNVYWVFDGFHGTINRYDFNEDHGLGYDDHCDGDIQRWAGTGVERVRNVVSHMALDHDTGLLYIADTGNGRIAVLDTASGERGADLPSSEDFGCQQDYGVPGPAHYRWNNGEMTDLVTGLDEPAGIALVDGTLFVTEHGTGFIRAYDLLGTQLDWADTGLGGGALQGITAHGPDDLWVVDSENNEVLRLQAPVE